MNSVAIKSVDAAKVRQCADDYARELVAAHPEIEEIIIFGSFAKDTYAPGSDLDVFIVLEHASRPMRDRIAAFVPASSPVPVDVFPFTRAEMEELASSPLLAAVSESGWRYSR